MKKFVTFFSLVVLITINIEAQTEIKLPFLKNTITISNPQGEVKFEPMDWLKSVASPFGDDFYMFYGNLNELIRQIECEIPYVKSSVVKKFITSNLDILIRNSIFAIHYLMPHNSVLTYNSAKNEFGDGCTYTLKVLQLWNPYNQSWQQYIVLGVK